MDKGRMKCYTHMTSTRLIFFSSAQFARQIDGCSQSQFISETFDQRFGGSHKEQFSRKCLFLMRTGTIWVRR